MKKTYIKPEIVFEDFTVNTNIAAGCEIKIDNHSQGGCGYKYEGGHGETMFTTQAGTAVCNLAVNDDENNGFCYNIPVQSINIFNS